MDIKDEKTKEYINSDRKSHAQKLDAMIDYSNGWSDAVAYICDKGKFKPIEPVHPVDLLVDEVESREWKYVDVAKQLGITTEKLTEMIEQKLPITFPMACTLEKVFGIDADTWINLQNDYYKDRSYNDYLNRGWFYHTLLSDYRYDERSVKSGIEWAMENPNWHKYPEETPCCLECLVVFKDDSIGIHKYSIADRKFYERTWNDDKQGFCEDYSFDKDIIAWMELPKINYQKEEK